MGYQQKPLVHRDCSANWPEGIEGFLSDVVFADGVLKADVKPISLVHHVEAGILMMIRNEMVVKCFLESKLDLS